MTVLTDAPAPHAPTIDAPIVDGPVIDLRQPAPAQTASASVIGPVVVPVCGALDARTVARVREALDEAVSRRPARLVVDLTDCPFVDASSLAMLLEAHRRLARCGSVLTLRGCSPRVLRLLSLTGLRRVFDLT